ncbi:hypothetical protein BGZ65_002889 [Modicella reniformis]|uniref:Uncharacterized protein n=1 Tax=Modicella reniformis TaxID=1440133 RepID=A0A9P6MLK5_9FUNG|nr:hypothetical protein BGZ65_002889 [Modicella reniformis]
MADQAFPTAPTAPTIWTPGQAVTVTWRLTTPSDKTALPVELFKGDPAKQALVKSWSVRIGDSWSHYSMIKSKEPMLTPAVTNASTPIASATGSGSGSSAGSKATTTGSVSSSPNSAIYLSTSSWAMGAVAVAAAAAGINKHSGSEFQRMDLNVHS